MEEASDVPSKRRIDGMTAVMVLVTVAALLGAVWLQVKRQPAVDPPTAGGLAPPLRLLDVNTSEPTVLVGLRGKVVWIVFWSAESPSGGPDLAAFDRAWSMLKSEEGFAMVAAAVEADKPDRVRAIVAKTGVKLPVYMATAETRRRFGVEKADPPLSVLIDADGQISTLANGASARTIERIAEQAQRLIEALGPTEDTRFAIRQ